MNHLLMIAAAAGIVFGCRWIGLNLRQFSIQQEALFEYLPIAIFSAFVVSALVNKPDFLPGKFVAMMVVAIISTRTRHFALTLLIGLAVYWGWTAFF